MKIDKKPVHTYRTPFEAIWSDKLIIEPRGSKVTGIRRIRNELKRKFVGKYDRKGYTFEITDDNVAELLETLEKYSKIKFENLTDNAAGFVDDVLTGGMQAATEDQWEKLAHSIERHMKRLVYASPKAKRNVEGGQRTQALDVMAEERKQGLVGGSKEKYLMVGERVGPFQRRRTGKLVRSIGHTVLRRSDRPKRRSWIPLKDSIQDYRRARRMKQIGDYKKERSIAIGIRVGPGAGEIPAPSYTDAANDGAGPKKGTHYFPLFGVRLPGGNWRGFEAKFFIEGTGYWLKRTQKQLLMNTDMLARIYVDKAVAEFKSRGGIPHDIQQTFIKDLHNYAIEVVSKNLSISTKKFADELADYLIQGKINKMKQRGKPR